MKVVSIYDSKLKIILTPETKTEEALLDELTKQSECATKLSDSPEHAHNYGTGSIMIQ
jgi:hypothetical protein